MPHPYLRRRQGLEAPEILHPSLDQVLKRTMGVPLFQEQLLRMAMIAANFTGGEAEALRRAMGFRRSQKRMADVEECLRAGMIANGITGKTQDAIVQSITAFALYGFPESHAASFALLSYASAYLKEHYLAAFTAAILNSQPMGFCPTSACLGSFGLICPRALSPTTPELVPVASPSVLPGFISVGGLATFVFLSLPKRVNFRYRSRVRLPSRTSSITRLGYMLNGKFTWRTPCSSQDRPGLSWHPAVREPCPAIGNRTAQRCRVSESSRRKLPACRSRGNSLGSSPCNKLLLMALPKSLLALCFVTAISAAENPFLGRWNFNLPIRASWLGITEKNGALEVWYQPTGGNVYQLKEVRQDGNHLSLAVVPANDRRPAVTWELDATVGRLVGTQLRAVPPLPSKALVRQS